MKAMTEDYPQQYTTDDVSRIIRRALKIEQSDSLSHQELLDTAKELGIAPGKIEEAIQLEASALERDKFKKEYLKRKRSSYKARLWSFVTLNTIVFIINAMRPGPWWFQWVLLGTGIGLIVNFRKTYFPTEYQIEKAQYRHEKLKNRPRRRHYA